MVLSRDVAEAQNDLGAIDRLAHMARITFFGTSLPEAYRCPFCFLRQSI
jgi:hypothetical protein